MAPERLANRDILSRKSFKSRLSPLDAIMWREGVDRQILTIVTNIAILDRRPDHVGLFTALDRMTTKVPRLRQIVRPPELGQTLPYWEDDPHFSLANHIHLAHLPTNATARQLLDLAAAVLTHTFSTELPMWSLTVVDGLERGGTALIIKRHHALMDGSTLARLVLDISAQSNQPFADDAEYEPFGPQPAIQAPGTIQHGSPSQLSLTASSPVQFNKVFASIRAAIPQLWSLLAPARRGSSSIMRRRSRARRHYMITRPVEDFRRAAHAAGASLNDVFLAGVALAMRAYHRHHDASDRELTVSLPVNLRQSGATTDSGNEIALIRTVLPLTIESPQACIHHFHRIIAQQRQRLRRSGDSNAVVSRLPSFMVARICGAVLKSVDVGTTNVNCSNESVRVGGATVVRYATFSELCGAALNIALYRYGPDVTLGITVDPAAVPDPDFLNVCFEQAFDAVTGNLLAAISSPTSAAGAAPHYAKVSD